MNASDWTPMRIFFDEPEIEIEESQTIPTEEEVDSVINEYQSPTGSCVYFPDEAHDSLIAGLNND